MSWFLPRSYHTANVLRLHALGGLYLERDGVRVDSGATQRKRLALLAVLAVEQSGATRDKVAALLWPESDAAHSRNALASLGNLTEARRRLADFLRQTDSDCGGNAEEQLALELTAHGDSADAESVYEQIRGACQRDDERLSSFAGVKDSIATRARSRVSLGVALYRMGRLDEAKRALEWSMAQLAADADTRLEATKYLGRIAARGGDHAGAERAMRAFPLDTTLDESYSSIEYAAIAALLGDRDRAMQRLVAASNRLPYARLHRDPDFDSMRGYPPFDALITLK